MRLWDLTRADLMNDVYAIEVDWAHKWAEGIGQALYYAAVSDRKPAVLLLVKGNPRKGANPFHIYRAQTVCARHGIKLYLEYVDGN